MSDSSQIEPSPVRPHPLKRFVPAGDSYCRYAGAIGYHAPL